MASSSKKKKIQKMEAQDAEGISRKKYKFTINPTVFIIIKLIIIALIPFFYFIYSPMLIFVFIAYIGLFFLARLAERSMNKSVIRSNHIHISKIDSGVALIVVMIAVCGGVMSMTKKNVQSTFQGMSNKDFIQMRGDKEESDSSDNSSFPNFPFGGGFGSDQTTTDDGNENNIMSFDKMKKNMVWVKIKQNLVNIGSLLTGNRNLFAEEQSFNFTPSKPPEDFITDSSEIPELPEGLDFGDLDMSEFGGIGGGRGKDFMFSMDNIPINYVTSSTMSTINSILIFTVAGMGLLSIFAIFIKKHKFEKEMNEVIVEGKIEMLSNEELNRILSFGEEVDESTINQNEIAEKIKAENLRSSKSKNQSFDFVDEKKQEEIIEEDIQILNENFDFNDED